MENFLIVARQVIILFVLMGVGALARRFRLIEQNSIRGIVNVLILIVTPCLIVSVFQRPFDGRMLGGLGIAFLFAMAIHLLTMLAVRRLYRRAPPDTESVLKVATVFSNAGFMGIPLEQAILGDAGVFYGAVYIVVFNLLMWSWGLKTIGGREVSGGMKMWINPGTVGLACGIVVFLLPCRLPAAIGEPVRLLAGLNTPLAMIVIGFYLAGANLAGVLRNPLASLASAVRLVAVPLVVIAMLYPLRHAIDRTLMLAIVIPAAAPVGAMVTMFASQYRRDVEMSVGMVSGTTLLSMLSLPVVIALAMSVL